MSCECYPEAYGLNRGCKGAYMCWVLKELREGQTPEGRAAQRERYHAEAQKRLSAPVDGEDIAFKLTKLGVPGTALVGARKPDDCEAMEGARRFWKGDRRLVPALVLMGKPGVGKSTAAAWVCLQWGAQYAWNGQASGGQVEPLMWVDGPVLRKAGAFDGPAAETMERVSNARMVVVDDAGREGSRPAMEALSDVLVERLDHRRPFVLSTNLAGQPFRERYGEALADRLRASALVVAINGKSLRKPHPTVPS